MLRPIYHTLLTQFIIYTCIWYSYNLDSWNMIGILNDYTKYFSSAQKIISKSLYPHTGKKKGPSILSPLDFLLLLSSRSPFQILLLRRSPPRPFRGRRSSILLFLLLVVCVGLSLCCVLLFSLSPAGLVRRVSDPVQIRSLCCLSSRFLGGGAA